MTHEINRAARSSVRNPLLSLPAAQQVQALPLECRLAMRALLGEIAVDAAARAEHSWKKSKGADGGVLESRKRVCQARQITDAVKMMVRPE